MAKNPINQLDHIEERIISGQISEAAESLSKISLSQISRSEMVRASRLFRRVGAFEQSLRLLLPIIRPKGASADKATPQEITECAISLQRGGSYDEACELLEQVSPVDVPEVLLYKSTFRFSEWDYRGGVKHLLQLMNACERDSYLQRLAQLNLASALVVEERWSEAEALLNELRATTSERGEFLIFSSALEVSAQVAIFTGKYNAAEEFLTQAEAVHRAVGKVDGLWVTQWRAINTAFKTKNTAPLKKARAQAVKKQNWEAVREFDFALCKVKLDANVYLQLYFGTQFPGYRRRLMQVFGEPTEATVYIHAGGKYKATGKKALLITSELKGELSPGQLPHSFFMLLLSDAYRSLRVGQIHSQLFPNEYFNPDTSLKRVEQVVKLTRKALAKQIPGVKIVGEEGIYRLDLSKMKRCLEMPKDRPAIKSAKRAS